MPIGGGAVYQPTTVSYEPRCASERVGGLGLLGPSASLGVESPLRVFRKSRPQVALLVFAFLTLLTGLTMLASCSAMWLEAKAAYVEEVESTTNANVNDIIVPGEDMPMGLLLGGIFMTCLGLFGFGMYLKVADWRKNCVCPCTIFDKKQMQCQNGGVGINANGGTGVCNQDMAMNPSTDPLVSHTQYAAVSELPSLRVEDEERHNLMPDNKDCVSSAEESDRMLEPDPRIVLRPMQHVEDA